ncbi:MAG TPA: hypothetical protein VGS27_36750 [Candidatus Sulfotelmatobacter sp.]|nr:hypothetical protein [Candidatus Sulfotelmatobacter sp.]
MRRLSNFILLTALVAFGLTGARAQDTPIPAGNQEPDTSGQQQAPVPAFGQEGSDMPISENPPLSGIDLPSLEPHAAPLSYIQPGATVSESADTNATNTPGYSSTRSVTRALGSLDLHRLWSHYDLALEYIGGVGYYNIKGLGFTDMQQASVDQKINWKRGSLSLRDSFSYLPEGNFGGAYGALGSQGISSLGTTAFGSFWGGTALGALGFTPRIMNVSLADLQESLSPKSAITITGGYAITHFYDSQYSSSSFIGSSQASFQAAYNRSVTSHTQLALVYGYQAFDFSVSGTAFHTHVIEGLYGHRISGRMDLLLGAGPQLTFIDNQSAVCSDPTVSILICQFVGDTLGSATVKNTKVGVAAQGRLRYHFPKASLMLSYERFQTSGSGIFAGAQTDIVRLNLSRPLTRKLTGFVDAGFSRNQRVQPLTVQQVEGCTGTQPSNSNNACPANNATSYDYGFVGFGLHRAFGRTFHGYVSYQFNELAFDNSYCLASGGCSRISNRQIINFGLDWTPRPIRID